MTKADYNVIKRYASNVIAEQGGILQAYAYIEYILAKIEWTICQNRINHKLRNQYDFYSCVLDEVECRIYMN